MQLVTMNEDDTLEDLNIDLFRDLVDADPSTGLTFTFDGFKYRVTGQEANMVLVEPIS